MLRTRILTALVLLPLVLAAIFALAPGQFVYLLGLLLIVGSWEFHRLAGLRPLPWGGLLITLQGAIMAVLLATWDHWTANPVPPFALACLAWGLMFLQMLRYGPQRQVDTLFRVLGFCNALLVVSTGWAALSWLRLEPYGHWWILLLLVTIWAADVGAYFAGRAFGRRKLAPSISPGKTWAGVYGGVASAALVATAVGIYAPGIAARPLQLAILGAVTAVVSVGGDLFISMHKRTVGLKDTGRLFPGHGGLLDRIDSLMAGAPFFVLAKLLAGL